MGYIINGRVVDAADSPLPGLRVEAWDKDPGADDYLGWAETDANGNFVIAFSDYSFQDVFEVYPDIYFKIFHCDHLAHSTEDSVLWNAKKAVDVKIVVKAKLHAHPCGERHIYLKIERIDDYSPVRPQAKVAPPITYGRDCMRFEGHETGVIPEAEIQARSLTAIVYREYLDAAYLVPKPDKLILADINEPVFSRRVPGTALELLARSYADAFKVSDCRFGRQQRHRQRRRDHSAGDHPESHRRRRPTPPKRDALDGDATGGKRNREGRREIVRPSAPTQRQHQEHRYEDPHHRTISMHLIAEQAVADPADPKRRRRCIRHVTPRQRTGGDQMKRTLGEREPEKRGPRDACALRGCPIEE